MIQNDVLAKFKEIFGDEGDIRVYFAPGRVNLIGEHTDYNGGHVFPCALTIGTYMAARKRTDRKLCFYSMNFDELGVIESSLDAFTPDPDGLWTNYPMGRTWHETGNRSGYCIIRKYSKRFRTFFFRILRSGYRIYVKGSVWF